MKTNKPHNFLLLALTAVFSCCSGEDYSDITVSGTPSGETSTAPLTITVTDGGYASLSGGSSTRASEVDYQTVFTEGDKIGVFAVKDNAIVKEVSNLCLTATPSTDTNAALTWKSDSDETPASINGATYYAYYPYKSDLRIEDLAPTASNADGFFASIITNWTPAKHQSTYADSRQAPKHLRRLYRTGLNDSARYCRRQIPLFLHEPPNGTRGDRLAENHVHIH